MLFHFFKLEYAAIMGVCDHPHPHRIPTPPQPNNAEMQLSNDKRNPIWHDIMAT